MEKLEETHQDIQPIKDDKFVGPSDESYIFSHYEISLEE